jgi:hypothetical protein
MWRVRGVGITAIANATGDAFVTFEADRAHGASILGPNGALGAPLYYTTAAYASTVSPALGVVPAGMGIGYAPNISPSFTNNAVTGTEYIMVSGGVAVTMKAPATASGAYIGNMHIFVTDDPVRHSLAASSVSTLQTAAALEGALIHHSHYRITQSGGFVEAGMEYESSTTPGLIADTGSRQTIGVPLILTNKTSYEWQRCNLAVTTVPTNYSILITFDQMTPNAEIDVEWVMSWQTEKYPTAEARAAPVHRVPIPVAGNTTAHQLASQAAAQSLAGYRPWIRDAAKKIQGLNWRPVPASPKGNNGAGFFSSVGEEIRRLPGQLAKLAGQSLVNAIAGKITGRPGAGAVLPKAPSLGQLWGSLGSHPQLTAGEATAANVAELELGEEVLMIAGSAL